jgi:hypothetical protein
VKALPDEVAVLSPDEGEELPPDDDVLLSDAAVDAEPPSPPQPCKFMVKNTAIRYAI